MGPRKSGWILRDEDERLLVAEMKAEVSAVGRDRAGGEAQAGLVAFVIAHHPAPEFEDRLDIEQARGANLDLAGFGDHDLRMPKMPRLPFCARSVSASSSA